ncbi:TPA: hypothetical protein QB310_000391 [Pasteurella multocida]|nr:hypothetical protein [Pasteurella multocida]
MEGKNRDDLVFNLHYSYNIENLNYHFNARLNNLLTLIQLLLSSAIIGDLSRYTSNLNIDIILGLILTVISSLVIVYRFGEKLVSSRIAADRYSALIHRHSNMSDNELANALLETNSINNQITGAFADIAYKRSSIQLNREDITELTPYQSIIAKFCGENFNERTNPIARELPPKETNPTT